MTFVNEIHLMGYVTAIGNVHYYDSRKPNGDPVRKAIITFALWGRDKRPRKGETHWCYTCIVFDHNAETFHAKVRVDDKVLVFGHLRTTTRRGQTLPGTPQQVMVACRFCKLIHPSLRRRQGTHVLIPIEDVERVREAEELLYSSEYGSSRTAMEVSQAETGTSAGHARKAADNPPADVTMEPIETEDAERPEYERNPDLPDDWNPPERAPDDPA